MSKLDDLKETLYIIQSLSGDLKSPDEETISDAETLYQQSLREFYSDNADMLAPWQYKAAKGDPEYLLRLIHLAIVYRENVEASKRN